MATYYPRYYFQDSVGLAEGPVKPIYHQKLMDFAVQNVTTADTVNMIPIPAQCLVLNAGYQTVTTITDATSTFIIASGTAGITYISSTTAVAAGLYGVPAAISASTAQKWYGAKDNLQLKTVAVASLLTGQMRVFAVMMYPQPTSYVDVDGNTQTYTFVDRSNWTTTAPSIP